MYVGRKNNIRRALLTTAILCLAGCSGNLADNNNGQCSNDPPEVKAQRVAAFGQTVRPVLLSHNCASCHDGISGKAPYPHSAPDPSAGYTAAKTLANFGDPESSLFVQKIRGSHNCGDANACQALGDQLRDEITAWAKLESALPAPASCDGNLQTGLTIMLPAKDISLSSLSYTGTTSFRWDVGAVNPAVGQVTFEVLMQNYAAPAPGAPGSYLMQMPTIATATMRLEIVGITPVINGITMQQYANYSAVNFVVDNTPFDPTASVLGFRPISTSSMVVNWVNTPNVDHVGFKVVLKQTTAPPTTTTSLPGCKSLDKFQVVYDNVFDLQIPNPKGGFYGQCTQCHGSTQSPAIAVMNLGGGPVPACLNALMRTNLTNPEQSLLILKPSLLDQTALQGGGDAHPVKWQDLAGAAYDAQKTYMLQWIADEAAKAAAGN